MIDSPRRRATHKVPGTVVDMLIIGAGPAGLVTAIEARFRGLSVTVLERRGRRDDGDTGPEIDKACGEGLMPDGLARLRALGVELPIHHTITGIRYVDGDVVVEGRFPDFPGAGIRRTRLHRALVARAETLGVDIRWGVKAEALTASRSVPEVETSEGPCRGRLIVGADGLRSRVRTWAGLGREPGRRARRAARFGVRRHYALAPWTDRVEVHWSNIGEAYVTPVAPDEVGVAMLWSGRKARFDDLLSDFPSLYARLRGGQAISRDRGAGPLRQRTTGMLAGSVALVGDAAGYVDAITGEGLSLAFHQARALVECFAEGRLGDYPRAVKRLAWMPNALTHLLLTIEARPALRRRAIRALAAEPSLFEGFLAVHSRQAGPWSLVPQLPSMAWNLARASNS